MDAPTFNRSVSSVLSYFSCDAIQGKAPNPGLMGKRLDLLLVTPDPSAPCVSRQEKPDAENHGACGKDPCNQQCRC